MELEVYNEYAIVQHYSDLTDYISENIYILDKKNQSEIITENWGLIAIGAVILAGLIWLIIHLVNNHKNNQNKEKKNANEAKQTEKLAEVTEQAIEKSDKSKDEIKTLSDILKILLLKNNLSFTKDKDSEDFKGNDYGYIYTKSGSSLDRNDLKDIIQSLKAKTKSMENVDNLIGKMISKLSWKEIQNSLIKMIDNDEYHYKWTDSSKNQYIALRIPLSQKTKNIIGSFMKSIDWSNLMNETKIKVKEDENIKNRGSHSTTSIANIDEIKTKVKKLVTDTSFTTENLSDNEKKAMALIKKINQLDFNLDITEPTVNDTNKQMLKDIDEVEKNTTITTILGQYRYILHQLLDKIDEIDEGNDESEQNTMRSNVMTLCCSKILNSILALYTNPDKSIKIKEIQIKKNSSKPDTITIETLTSSTNGGTTTTSANTKNMKDLKTKLEKIEKSADKTYKKAFKVNIERIMQEMLYLEYQIKQFKNWMDMYKVNLLSVLGVSTIADININSPSAI